MPGGGARSRGPVGVLLAHARPLHAAAGLFLLYLGLKALFARPDAEAAGESGRPVTLLRAGFAGSILLTLANPPTIIMFAAIFAALAPASGFGPLTALLTVAGVVTGSLLWWCAVIAAVAAFRHALGATARLWISRGAGIALAVFGLAELRRTL